MNTGIQDAHNLAWKISCLLKDAASPSLIKTYESERRPIAISNTALSVNNFKAAMSVPAALGIDPTVANTVHQVINSSFGSILPSTFQKAALEGIFSIGRAQLSDFVLNENNPLGSSRLARLRAIFDEGKIGFRYLKGALVADSDNETQETVETAATYKRGSRDYVPSGKPGSRLPHMQLRMLNASENEDSISTLDLISVEKLEFLLIIAPLKDSYDVARVAFKVAETLRVSLKVCVIWAQGSAPADASGSGQEVEPWKNYVDVEEIQRSNSKSWWEVCQMSNRGVILVRPDDHIAWSTEIDSVENIVQQVERVFFLILGAVRTSS
ncbi:uncharacterized protein A4U43_C04F5180 [Asparagus officinalis]|uniref:FAD-binding domain-containing protein n=1 Tax=Asparagus officinalis TaxID=4686 RepID=A0A5P1EYH4_ASPOF|nr:uncharacterized protein LOC109838207 [Asparagus officinalis]ONK71146.1 uncharacterized protein A4U43_C04F5180 [Asparagus officinalis]